MNLFDYGIPTTGENFTTLLGHKNIKISRIISSDNIETKRYIQDEDEWVVVLEGEALLQIDGEDRRMIRGDMLMIPAKTPHKVLQTQKGTLWLAIYIS
jgi:cupin 2 domain-containing protein